MFITDSYVVFVYNKVLQIFKFLVQYIPIQIEIIFKRVIKGTKIPVEIERMESRDKDHTWKTDTHNKEYKITKIIHTK